MTKPRVSEGNWPSRFATRVEQAWLWKDGQWQKPSGLTLGNDSFGLILFPRPETDLSTFQWTLRCFIEAVRGCPQIDVVPMNWKWWKHWGENWKPALAEWIRAWQERGDWASEDTPFWMDQTSSHLHAEGDSGAVAFPIWSQPDLPKDWDSWIAFGLVWNPGSTGWADYRVGDNWTTLEVEQLWPARSA